jgi:hypothetical protein
MARYSGIFFKSLAMSVFSATSKKLIRRVRLEAPHGTSGIVQCHTRLQNEFDHTFAVECAIVPVQKMRLVPEKNMPKNPPHVVLRIRVVKVHAPAMPRRRKTPEHQEFGVCRQKRLERMFFDGDFHAVNVALYIVQKTRIHYE